MSEEFNNIIYKLKRDAFFREYKRVEPYENRRKLTNNLKLIEEYEKCLRLTYSDLTRYLVSCYESSIDNNQELIEKHLESNKKLLIQTLNILGVTFEFDCDGYELIDSGCLVEGEDTLKEIEEHNESISSNFDIAEKNSLIAPQITSDEAQSSNSCVNNSNSQVNLIKVTMAQTSKEFISMANHMISSKFNGDPLGLDSFIDSVELLKELCEEQNNAICLKFVTTRLEGKAREKIPNNPEKIEDIIESLKSSIKNEPSKVVEGRILALRADRGNLTKFSERAEELAEQFRRSLCTEGFSKDKAKELAIEKTVEMCRKSSRSETVKAILAASKFDEPKDVIAKMLIEINNVKQEKTDAQIQKFFNKTNRNGQNNSGNSNRNDNNGNHNNGNRNNGNRHNDNNFQRNGNQNRNTNFQNRSHNNGYNNNANNNNSRGNRNDNNGNNRSNSNFHTIRVVSGNDQMPQAGRQDQSQIPL